MLMKVLVIVLVLMLTIKKENTLLVKKYSKKKFILKRKNIEYEIAKILGCDAKNVEKLKPTHSQFGANIKFFIRAPTKTISEIEQAMNKSIQDNRLIAALASVGCFDLDLRHADDIVVENLKCLDLGLQTNIIRGSMAEIASMVAQEMVAGHGARGVDSSGNVNAPTIGNIETRPDRVTCRSDISGVEVEIQTVLMMLIYNSYIDHESRHKITQIEVV